MNHSGDQVGRRGDIAVGGWKGSGYWVQQYFVSAFFTVTEGRLSSVAGLHRMMMVILCDYRDTESSSVELFIYEQPVSRAHFVSSVSHPSTALPACLTKRDTVRTSYLLLVQSAVQANRGDCGWLPLLHWWKSEWEIVCTKFSPKSAFWVLLYGWVLLLSHKSIDPILAGWMDRKILLSSVDPPPKYVFLLKTSRTILSIFALLLLLSAQIIIYCWWQLLPLTQKGFKKKSAI